MGIILLYLYGSMYSRAKNPTLPLLTPLKIIVFHNLYKVSVVVLDTIPVIDTCKFGIQNRL